MTSNEQDRKLLNVAGRQQPRQSQLIPGIFIKDERKLSDSLYHFCDRGEKMGKTIQVIGRVIEPKSHAFAKSSAFVTIFWVSFPDKSPAQLQQRTVSNQKLLTFA